MIKKIIFFVILSLIIFQFSSLAQPETAIVEEETIIESPEATFNPQPQSLLIALQGTEHIQLQLVNCWEGLDCALARLILPQSALINHRQLNLDNRDTTPVEIINTDIVLSGNLTNYQLTAENIFFDKKVKSLPANRISNLSLNIDRSQLPPEQYMGAIYLTLANRAERFILPIGIDVRVGPLIPLIVIFLGIIIGRLIKYMNEEGTPQAETLKAWNRLKLDIREASLSETDKKELNLMADDLRKMINRQQLEAAKIEEEILRNRLNILIDLTRIEQQINNDIDLSQSLNSYLTLARQYLFRKEDEKCQEILQKINDLLDSSMATARGGVGGVFTLNDAINRLTQNIEHLPYSITPKTGLEHFQHFLITLSGVSEQVRTDATFYIARPLLSLVLLIGLSIVGMGSLYVENGRAFGANPFADYLGLVLWGLSADVTSRKLSNLQDNREE